MKTKGGCQDGTIHFNLTREMEGVFCTPHVHTADDAQR